MITKGNYSEEELFKMLVEKILDGKATKDEALRAMEAFNTILENYLDDLKSLRDVALSEYEKGNPNEK